MAKAKKHIAIIHDAYELLNLITLCLCIPNAHTALIMSLNGF